MDEEWSGFLEAANIIMKVMKIRSFREYDDVMKDARNCRMFTLLLNGVTGRKK